MSPAKAIVGQRYNPTENRVKADAGVAPVAGLTLGKSNQRVPVSSNLAVRRALEAAGFEFIDENGGPGVRLRKDHRARDSK